MAFHVSIENGCCFESSMPLSGQSVLAESNFYSKGQFIVGWRVNHYLRSLNWLIDDDSSVEFVDTSSAEGASVYNSSLSFLLSIACHRVLNREICVRHSISDGLYWELEGEPEISEENVKTLENEMQRIISLDLPFVRSVVSLDKARRIFEGQNMLDKARLLSRVVVDPVEMYSCMGEYGFFFGPMVPSTGYLKIFALTYVKPGLVMRGPTLSSPMQLTEFRLNKKLFNVFTEYASWLRVMGVATMEELHAIISRGDSADLALLAEAFHSQRLSELTQEIISRPQCRVIAIAGPSASGKTTTSHKLRTQLAVVGRRTHTISLDDYFLDRDKTPLDENGNHNFESVDALNLPLLKEQVNKLMAGETVCLPHFDFISGKSLSGNELKLGQDDLIVVEGLHALNDRLLDVIPKEKRFGIFASPLTGVNLDKHNRIGTTDNRLFRRMVRDWMTRGYTPQATLKRWPSVVRGGMKYIFPYQKNADAMFNSSLIYEIPILKNKAEPLLRSIPEDSSCFGEAQRLLRLLKFVPSMSENLAPNNSIIREFIGGSIIDID